MKYLEEKHLMKTVVQHLKSELSRINCLEEELSNANKETNKLSVQFSLSKSQVKLAAFLQLIAEFNKQQGEKLKEEITHKDCIINHLKANIQKMSQMQMQVSKEKMDLCQELSEVPQLKEKLISEVKKNAELDQSKEQMVKTVSCQVSSW